ncbi:hypothetical protein PENSPDRAFT_685791 [Peniophora sp. CONT]|nr:hypothetical protein PENSPDRAFT_685791 [Peniophora sp. CONT]
MPPPFAALPHARLNIVDGDRLQVMVDNPLIQHVDVIAAKALGDGMTSQVVFKGSETWRHYDHRYGSQTQEESPAPDEYSRDGYSQKGMDKVADPGARVSEVGTQTDTSKSVAGPAVRTASTPLPVSRHDAIVAYKADLIVHLSDFFAVKRSGIPVELARAAMSIEPDEALLE